MNENFDLRPLLAKIDPASCTYDEWLNVGMALKHEGYPMDVWEAWSAYDAARFKDGECAQKWAGFNGSTTPVTGAAITQMAKERGWLPQRTQEDKALDWDSAITDAAPIVDKHYMEAAKEIREPDRWDPIADMLNYMTAVFRRDDIIAVSMRSFEKQDDPGRFVPDVGDFRNTAGYYIDRLKKYRLKAQQKEITISDAISFAMGDYNPQAGAWIRFNPFDGQGVKNANVTDFRFALVESDSMEPGMQEALIRELELPVAALVYSGGKSVHAIVHIDAESMDEYKKRVQNLYQVCKKNGLKVDDADRNPSRLSRLPGVWRKDRKQFLIATKIGKPSYEEWVEWVEGLNDDLPDPESLSSVWDNMPDLAPALIEGVLRMGHKLLLAGPSKAGKSFALIELCVAIAEGSKWLQTFQCRRGNVLYCNLELDRASCLHRFKDVYTALGIAPEHLRNIDIWNLRGQAIPMDKLAPKLIRRAQKKNYTAVIIDPIYKVITGDENSADQMAHFCNQFDKIATELHSAVIYCHHHSKGGQGMKRSIDRSSGSGVFARDPDAILDMIPLAVESERSAFDEEADRASGTVPAPAFRITGTLREFPSFPPINLWFRYPVHKVDDTGLLKMAAEEGSLIDIQARGRKAVNDAKKTEKEKRVSELNDAFDTLSDGGKPVELKSVAEYFGVSEKTVRRYVQASDDFLMGEGKMYRK